MNINIINKTIKRLIDIDRITFTGANLQNSDNNPTPNNKNHFII